MRQEDYSYFRRRIVEEESAIRNAAGPQARERHQELAEAYQLRCKLIQELIGQAPVEPRSTNYPAPDHEVPLYHFGGPITSDRQASRAKPESSGVFSEQVHYALKH